MKIRTLMAATALGLALAAAGCATNNGGGKNTAYEFAPANQNEGNNNVAYQFAPPNQNEGNNNVAAK
jgi:hypothetical protein